MAHSLRAPRRLRLGAGSTEVWQRLGFRVLFTATLAVLLLLGVRDLVRPFVTGRPSGATATMTTARYPRETAEAFAVRFATTYLTLDGTHPDARRRALQPYLPDGADASFGWDGSGHQAVLTAVPSEIDVRRGGRSLVTVAALVDSGRWLYLAVPVTADRDRIGLGGTPTLVPGPSLATAPAQGPVTDQDPVLSNQLQPDLAAFLRAYAQSDSVQLAYYEAPGAQLQGLSGQLAFGTLVSLSLEDSSGSTRSAVATVRWQDPVSGAGLTQRYRLQLVDAGDRWLVADVRPEENGA
ncbi:MAG TPA: conjugal transfer protein [Candidatus Eisenbacteria bacterium]|nr:conjugal transfer protein [Candidatus Eisenbacteria bacterium]